MTYSQDTRQITLNLQDIPDDDVKTNVFDVEIEDSQGASKQYQLNIEFVKSNETGELTNDELIEGGIEEEKAKETTDDLTTEEEIEEEKAKETTDELTEEEIEEEKANGSVGFVLSSDKESETKSQGNT